MANTSAYFEHGYALLIGIRYGHWNNPLEGPLRDVSALQMHFLDKNKAAYKAENIIYITEDEATKSGIIQALDQLAEKVANDPEANVLIYYSGHGGSINNKYFLIPYNFDLNSFYRNQDKNQETAIYSGEFANKINNIKSKKCMVVLDCCHAENMPVAKSLNRSSIAFNSFIDEAEEVFAQAEQKSVIPNALSKGEGNIIITSCRAEETSLDLGTLSLFTQVLLESLNGSNNIEKDGWVRLIDLMRYVPKTVSERAKNMFNHNQNPMFKRIENLGSEDFIICAYDIFQAKGIAKPKEENVINKPSSYVVEISNLIESGDIVKAFSEIDRVYKPSEFQYNRLKREFSAGLKGIDLLDFADRLKIYIMNLD